MSSLCNCFHSNVYLLVRAYQNKLKKRSMSDVWYVKEVGGNGSDNWGSWVYIYMW